MVLIMVNLIQPSEAAMDSQVIARGYLASTLLQAGTLVQVNSHNPGKVVPAVQVSTAKLLGVVVSPGSAAITFGQVKGFNQVYVINSGIQDVLVSNQNGSIRPGDYITVSSLAGIGMRADSNQPTIVGQAVGQFNGQSHVVRTDKLNIAKGQKMNIAIGVVSVAIGIAANPLTVGTRGVPSFLNSIIKKSTNKSISATRAYVSISIVLAGILLTLVVIYASIKNSIIALGRNPLAKKIIGINLARLIMVAMLILAISLSAAYAVLL